MNKKWFQHRQMWAAFQTEQKEKELSTTTTAAAVATARDRNKFNFQNFVYVDEKRALSASLGPVTTGSPV